MKEAKKIAIRNCHEVGLVFTSVEKWCAERADEHCTNEGIEWDVGETTQAQSRLRNAKNHAARNRVMEQLEEYMSSGSYLWIQYWLLKYKRWGF